MESETDNEQKIETQNITVTETETNTLSSECEKKTGLDDVESEKERDHTSLSQPETISRPTSSQSKEETGPRPKSSCSSEVVFTAKRKRKSKVPLGIDAHTVTFTVTIALAIPTEDDGAMPDIKDLMKKKKRVFEAPRAQSYYHLEYYLLPDDEEPIKTDVVTYGIAAKLYMERHDPRVLKTWQDGDVTWVAWTHSHCLTVTKEVLLQLFSHTLEVRIWDSKDKCSTRARFDRPKAFRIPQPKPGEDPDELGGVKSQVNKLTQSFASMQPKKSCFIRPLPSHITVPRDGCSRNQRRKEENDEMLKDAPPLERKEIPQDDQGTAPQDGSPTAHTLFSVKETSDQRNSSGKDTRTFSRLGRLAGIDSSQNDEPHPTRGSPGKGGRKSTSHRHHASPRSNFDSRQGRSTSPHGPLKSPLESDVSIDMEKHANDTKGSNKSPMSRRKTRLDGVSQSDLEKMKKNGICVVPVRMAILFAGSKNLTCRLDNPVAGVEDCFISVALDGPLMSEPQKKDLNPLIFKIHSATNLPNSPLNYDELQNRCNPVYCKYKFYKMADHRSIGRFQDRNIYWDDISVCLTGVLEPSEFRQFLNGPPLEVEIHDRERKQASLKMKPTLFGDDLSDEKINNVGTVTSRRTIHNAFEQRDKQWDPYGVAKVDLSELLLGNKFLAMKIPIHMCQSPDVLGLSSGKDKIMGISGAVDGPVGQPLPGGHYLESNSMLKVTIELAYPLSSVDDIAAKKAVQSTYECPFGRLVFKFDVKNMELFRRLKAVVSSINACALDLDDLPQHVITAALSTFKLSAEQQKSRDLDIVTGFHVMDDTHHLFVMEGLRDRGINRVWESLPQPENQDVTVLYNSDYTFSHRLYGSLDVDLCLIKLHEPLTTIVEQPLLYVRDMVPKLCFRALVKLKELNKIATMKEAIRNELFPSADMVISMSKEFGVPVTDKTGFSSPHLATVDEYTSPVVEMTETIYPAGRNWTPMDNFNPEYVEKMMDRNVTGCQHDFIHENIARVNEVSNMNRCNRSMDKVTVDVTVAHNYSTQTLNSTELAKEKLRRQLQEESKDSRFTYCPEFHRSMTVTPVNVDALKKEAKHDSERQWKTEDGWIYPGIKSAKECNQNLKQPDPARLEQLKEFWRENNLHANILEPTLHREKFPWSHRAQDMELYCKSKLLADRPLSIYFGGDQLERELQEARKADHDLWRSKVIVQNPLMKFHRCLPQTEQTERGSKGSNDIDRLNGLLKDIPTKMTLKKEGFIFKNIPPLKAIEISSTDPSERRTQGFNPGPHEELLWIREENKIPIYNYNHEQYQRARGQDFRLINRNHSFRYKRPIHGLTVEEATQLYGPLYASYDMNWKGKPLPPIEDIQPVHPPREIQSVSL